MRDLHDTASPTTNDHNEPPRATGPVAAAALGLLAFGAEIIEYLGAGWKGVWAFSLVLGLLAVGLGAGFVKGVTWDSRISWVAITFGALAAASSLFGLLGLIQSPFNGPGPKPDPTQSHNGASPESPTLNPPTSTGTGDTSSAGLPVALTKNGNPAALPLSVTATVSRPPSDGTHYWVVLQVSYAEGGVEFYGQKEITAGQGEAQRVSLQIPTSADLRLTRVAHVWQVTPQMHEEMQARLREPVGNRTPYYQENCGDCDVAEPIKITP